jgi:cell division protease FtsH
VLKTVASRTPAKTNSKRHRPSPFFVVAILGGAYLLVQVLLASVTLHVDDIPYSEFKQLVKRGQVADVTFDHGWISGSLKTRDTHDQSAAAVFDTVPPQEGDSSLLAALDAAGVTYRVKPSVGNVGPMLLTWGVPLLLISMVWYALAGRHAVGRGFLGVGTSTATEVTPEQAGVTYRDIGGADEAIGELREVVQFLTTPERIARLGGRIPKGVLLVGPPGTGKTLIARATAGEAGVPFFEMGGSEFVEMFVGVGAARVRDLFEQARRVAPAIVFIDEIDAIGQRRGLAARAVTNDEREQTLNQLLAEIDGFKADAARPVIIMAATNRPEVLDPALLRAGRFDRQVALGNPDLIGREQILRIHSRTIVLADDFDVTRAARITPGFSGADLARIINEAALLAARRTADAVTFPDFEAAMERVMAGLEKRTRVMSDGERRAVACHESGHAIVAQLVPYGDPVSKISIVPRSLGALGYTLQMPSGDRFLLTIDELEDRLAIMLGGRAAERVIFGTLSTGANDDIQRATELARRMVTEFGMSEKLGSVRYAGPQLQYLAGEPVDTSHLSPQTRDAIDAEVRRLVDAQLARAGQLLVAHRPTLESLTDALLKHETLDGSVVRQTLAREHAAA